jgi:hypothetical protein
MSHTHTVYKFQTENQAKDFIEYIKSKNVSIDDNYIQGPFFMDSSEIFKGWFSSATKETWWQVTIESFQ